MKERQLDKTLRELLENHEKWVERQDLLELFRDQPPIVDGSNTIYTDKSGHSGIRIVCGKRDRSSICFDKTYPSDTRREYLKKYYLNDLSDEYGVNRKSRQQNQNAYDKVMDDENYGEEFVLPRVYRINFSGTSIYNSNFHKVKFNHAIFIEAIIDECYLQKIILSHCKLNEAKITGSCLDDADFSNSDLKRINLDGAKLDGTKIKRSQLNSMIIEEDL